jgi:hypothetical protein
MVREGATSIPKPDSTLVDVDDNSDLELRIMISKLLSDTDVNRSESKTVAGVLSCITSLFFRNIN